MRQQISFADFERDYIAQPGGYLSVWFSFEEPEQEDDIDVPPCLLLEMDMVSPSRLEDGKIIFLSVQIDTKEQAERATKYLRETQKLLHESLEGNFTGSAKALSTLS